MKHVISASRRTDIPAFYGDWFVNRLEVGWVYVRNPFSGKISSVSLKPSDVSAIVFWSKNYAPLLPKLPIIERTTANLFFHFTITGNGEMEPSVSDWRNAIDVYRYLVGRYSRQRVIWRFDPLCITDKHGYEVHEERFVKCAELMRSCADRSIISFMHPYKKVQANFEKYSDHKIIELSKPAQREFATRLARRAETFNIKLFACCNDHLVGESLDKASCINGPAMEREFLSSIDRRPAGTRKECACTKSIDIGAYDTCAHGCLYCYATQNPEKARATWQHQDPHGNALGRQVDEEALRETLSEHPS